MCESGYMHLYELVSLSLSMSLLVCVKNTHDMNSANFKYNIHTHTC